MKKYQVITTAESVAQLNDIYTHICDELQNSAAAKDVYNKIIDGINSLEYFPKRCHLIESKRKIGLRKLIISNYSICYYIHKDTVIIVQILYNHSNIDAKLAAM